MVNRLVCSVLIAIVTMPLSIGFAEEDWVLYQVFESPVGEGTLYYYYDKQSLKKLDGYGDHTV